MGKLHSLVQPWVIPAKIQGAAGFYPTDWTGVGRLSDKGWAGWGFKFGRLRLWRAKLQRGSRS